LQHFKYKLSRAMFVHVHMIRKDNDDLGRGEIEARVIADIENITSERDISDERSIIGSWYAKFLNYTK
jgi:hypothetical protein